MMKIIKKIIGFDKIKDEINILQSALKASEELREIEAGRAKNYKHYTRFNIPNGQAMQSFLADLGKKEMFLFYLKTLEDSTVINFRDNGDPLITKGALRVISKIQADMEHAQAEEARRQNAQV